MPTVRLPINTRHSGDGPRKYTRVSVQDWLRFRHLPWSLANNYVRNDPRGYLNRLIVGLESGDSRQADHIDRDRLNNTRSNLRILTHAQNGQNTPAKRNSTSRYRGVSWERATSKWRAMVSVDGRSIPLGRFTDELDAAEAAREGRRKYLPYAVD